MRRLKSTSISKTNFDLFTSPSFFNLFKYFFPSLDLTQLSYLRKRKASRPSLMDKDDKSVITVAIVI